MSVSAASPRYEIKVLVDSDKSLGEYPHLRTLLALITSGSIGQVITRMSAVVCYRRNCTRTRLVLCVCGHPRGTLVFGYLLSKLLPQSLLVFHANAHERTWGVVRVRHCALRGRSAARAVDAASCYATALCTTCSYM